jgi:hypothetical protein
MKNTKAVAANIHAVSLELMIDVACKLLDSTRSDSKVFILSVNSATVQDNALNVSDETALSRDIV